MVNYRILNLKNVWLLLVPIILRTSLTVDSARILSVMPFPGASHYKVYEPLLKKLAERGHEVVSISHFPQKTKLPNFEDVDVRSTIPTLMNGLDIQEFGEASVIRNVEYIINSVGLPGCERILSHPGVTDLINKSKQFDLLMVQIFATDCFLGLAHRLNISRTIGMIASVPLPWSNGIVGNPENPAYVPTFFGSFLEDMSIYERLENTMVHVISKLLYKVLSDRESLKIARRHLGNDLPDFDELRSGISLILTNGHVAVTSPRPLSPGMKEIGGMHIPSSTPPTLETDLQDYLDSHNQDGVVYFSFGSLINSSSIPQDIMNIFYRAFAEIPQKVLWKCDETKIPPLPKNVRCIKWMPQLSVLCMCDTLISMFTDL